MKKTKTPAAPRRVPVAPVEIPDDFEDGEQTSPMLVPQHDEDDAKLSEFLEQFGGKEYKVRVEQFDKEEKTWEHLDTFAVDGFDAYDVCKRFGRGRYRLTFLNDKGKYVPGGMPQIRIGGLPASALAAAPVAMAPEDPFKNPLIAMMLANAEAQRKESAELIRAILTKPEPAKSTTNELLEMMVKLKSMEPKADDKNGKMMDAIMGTLIDRALNPDKPEAAGGGLMSEAREGLALLKESGVLGRLGAARPAAAPVTRVLASPTPALENPDMTPSPILVAMRPYAAIFRMKAENGVAPDQAASYLVDEVYETLIPFIKKHVALAKLASDETIIEILLARVQDEAQVEELFKFAPELEPHRPWVASVLSEVVKTMTAPEEAAQGEPNGNQA